jgi:hypothetical protein
MSANLHVLRMNETLRHVLAGAGSILLAPAGVLHSAQLRITLPPSNATDAIAHDFGIVSAHLKRAMAKVEHAEQMELELKS